MPQHIKLSELISQIEDTIQNRFAGETFWIKAEITDVKKYADKRWCFLKFIEKDGTQISTEIKGVFWGTSYPSIEKFERFTGQTFASGIEIICSVRVRFHKRFGLDLEVMDIDHAYTLGQLEMEKQQTLDRLLKENPKSIKIADGQYITANSTMELPSVLQRVALITAPNSDGQRDFKQELQNNRYGYGFLVMEFLTTIQGENASKSLIQQLRIIESHKEQFDVVAIVRGGGSQTDFKPFDDYDLALYVATFPIPILTGIGHDRNTSIVDMMARQHKTPTKVAAHIVDCSLIFESTITELKERVFYQAEQLLESAKSDISELKESLLDNLKHYFSDKNTALASIKRIVKSLSPETILNKGFAILSIGDKIITSSENISLDTEIQARLKDSIIYSNVTKKIKQ